MKTFAVAVFLLCCGCSAAAQQPISDFRSCVDAGNMILKTFPARCVTSDGQTFVDSEKPVPSEKTAPTCVDRCGDGSCQQIVCMGTECPCSESTDTCPQDCAS